MLATIVDTTAVLKILVAALIVGVGVTAIFGEGAMASVRLAQARRAGATGSVVGNAVLIGFVALVCLAVIAVGFLAMTKKSS